MKETWICSGDAVFPGKEEMLPETVITWLQWQDGKTFEFRLGKDCTESTSKQ